MTYAPIILFCYNRPDHTRRTLEALSRNILAPESELFVFADGPKSGCSPENLEKIQATRAVLKEKQWCGKVTINESQENKGLAANIISGVTDIANRFGSVIVLEDDIETGVHFLEYMNDALERYRNEKKVMHISAFRPEIPTENPDGSFFYPNMDCWGWATWADRWQFFEKNTDRLLSVFTRSMIRRFNMDGAEPGNWAQVVANKEGKINTWAIYWLATIFLKDGLCLGPCKSLARNIGFDNSGVHCNENPFEEIHGSIDHKVTGFPEEIKTDEVEYGKQIKFFKKKNRRGFKGTIFHLLRLICPRFIIKILRKILVQ